MEFLCLFVGVLIGIGIMSILRYRASPQQSIADVLSDTELLINELKKIIERQSKRVTFADVVEQKDTASEQKYNITENVVMSEQKDINTESSVSPVSLTESSVSPVSLTESSVSPVNNDDVVPVALRVRLADAISQIKQRKKIPLDSIEKSDMESVN